MPMRSDFVGVGSGRARRRCNAAADVAAMADRIGTQLLVAINKPATHHAVDDLAPEVPSVIDRETPIRVHAGAVGNPCPIEIDDGKVCVLTHGDGSLGSTAHA